MMKKITNVEQRIHGANYLNAERFKLLKKIQKEFKQLKGKKVQLSNGEKSKKWTLEGDTLNTVQEINGIKVYLSYQYYFHFSYSSVIIESKVCIRGGAHDVKPSTYFCQYIKNSDYIGRLENQILTDVDGIDICLVHVKEENKKPLNLKQFNKQKERYKKALTTLSDIKDAVPYMLRDFLPKY